MKNGESLSQTDTTKLEKTYVTITGEVVAGGPVRKIYSDMRHRHWLRCTSKERDALGKHGFLALAIEKPWVDIILVKYGQAVLEDQCISAIRECTDLSVHLLTDVDNKFIDKNLGGLWNDLIEASEAPYVLLLNTDAIVSPGWLDDMLKVALSSKADAVGPMTDKCGIAYQVGEKAKDFDIREVSQLSGFCVLIKKQAWEKAGGFPEFFPFYGQESDLMDRIGTKILCKHVFVKHLGGGTIKNTPGRSQKTEKDLSLDVYKKVRTFDWANQRLLVLGAGEGNRFPLWRGIDQACNEIVKRGGQAQHLTLEQIQDDSVLQYVRDYLPLITLVVCTNPTRLIESAKNLQHVPGARGLWYNDLRPASPEYVALHGCFRALFMCWKHTELHYDLEQWAEIIGAPTYYMPQGSIINPYLRRVREKYRALFIGGTTNGKYHTGRRDFFREIDATVLNAYKRNDRLQIEKRSSRLYRSARYSFAYSPNIAGYNSLRLYNMLAYGGLVLTKYFNGVDDLFESGRHLYTFKDTKNAEDLMHALDENADLREQVARDGWRLQQARHTVLWRILNMMTILQGNETPFWGNL